MKTPLATLYTNAIKGPIEKPKEEQLGQDQLMNDLKLKWLNSDISKQHIRDLEEELSKLIQLSIELSVSFPSHQNPHQIISNLVKASTIQKVLGQYGR